jgi:hypothetical protein
VAWAATLLLGRAPGLAESAAAAASALSSALARVSGLVPFALSEWVIAAFLLRQFCGAARGGYAVVRGRRSARNAAGCGALRLASDIGVAVTLFYLLWGVHYARAPLPERLDWVEPGAATAGADLPELGALAKRFLEATNAAYLQLHGTEDAGAPTPRPPDGATLHAALESGWAEAADRLGLPGREARPAGRVKRLLASGMLDRLGITGFYFPFTAEANANRGIPAVTLPVTLAHETAHRRGFASEDEANFIGFLAAWHAPDALARYAAALFAHRQTLSALAAVDPDGAHVLAEGRSPGVQRDLDDRAAYWRQFRGRARTAGRRVNDAYLRTNRVEGGVRSYGRSVALIVEWSRREPDSGPRAYDEGDSSTRFR